MTSMLYQSPKIYNFALSIMHRSTLQKRYEVISNHIDENESVLDIGCGTCMLSNFVDGEYSGIDMNDRFIKYGRKRGLNIYNQNIFSFNKYHLFDNCIIVDVLHHISPRHEEFLKWVIKKSKNKVIVCEPYTPDRRHKIIDKISQWLDYDGINKPEKWFRKRELIGVRLREMPCSTTILFDTSISLSNLNNTVLCRIFGEHTPIFPNPLSFYHVR